jgi:transposase
MDLGKVKTVVCDYDSDSGAHSFCSLRTRGQEIHDLVVERQPDRVVIEICTAAGWIHDLVESLGFAVEVANTNTEGWRWKNVKRKTDRKDALKLAQLSAMHQLPLVHMPKPEVRSKRSLITYRQRLVKRRTQIKNSIRAILDGQGYSMPAGKSGWTMKVLTHLRKMARKLEDCSIEQLWRGQLHVELCMLESVTAALEEVTAKLDSLARNDKAVQLVQTAAGVGPRLAEAIVAFLDEPERFKSGKQVGSYMGLTPKQYQSGQMNRQGRISGQGNKIVRALLVEVSWLGLRHNAWIRQTYYRLLRGSASRKKIAITGVARKLLVRCWAMLRDGKPWREENVSEAA